jgi:chromate transporter
MELSYIIAEEGESSMKRSLAAFILSAGQIGWAFLKIGIVFFGGGYVLIPTLHREMVQNLHWLSEREFLDGVAISQLTPGPVAILSTFCGYRQGGVIGALVATSAMFLPAFILMIIISKGYAHFKDIPAVRFVLNRIIPAIVGMLIAAAIQIGGSNLESIVGAISFIIALGLMIRWKVNPALLILVSAVLGIIFKF